MNLEVKEVVAFTRVVSHVDTRAGEDPEGVPLCDPDPGLVDEPSHFKVGAYAHLDLPFG